MDLQVYADQQLREHFTSAFETNSQVFSQFWPGNPKKTRQRLETLLIQLGFTKENATAHLNGDYLDLVAEYSARDARERFLDVADT